MTIKSPTPEQIAKLPKWAQQHIEQLTRKRDFATETLAEVLDKSHTEGAQWYYVVPGTQNDVVWLPAGAHLRVATIDSDPEKPRAGFDLTAMTADNGTIQITARSVHLSGMRISPEASNKIRIEADPYGLAQSRRSGD